MNADRVQTPADLLVAGELLLVERRCEGALERLQQAEGAGAPADRCAAGRWMAHMLLGDLAAAWRESDSIRGRAADDPHRFWNGESLAGKRVMLRCLHGYGDTVMYLRWLPQLRAMCRDMTVQAAPEMLPLLRCFADAGRVITWPAAGEAENDGWDVQIECAELPYLFRASLSTLPPPSRLVFLETQIHAVRLRLGQRTRPRVGLVWRGSDFDAARSIPFDQIVSVVRRQPELEFYSLQPPASNEDWESFCQGRGWTGRTFYAREDDGSVRRAGMADVAAFASSLDLIVTIDTLAAHLGGSLGVPTYLLLKHAADWRWMLDRADSPWYPGMRLFRQTKPGDWTGVLDSLCERLRDWTEETHA